MDKPIEPTQLRILLLEDEPTDAELMEDALREAGLSFIAKRVDTREAFIRALEEFKPDIVLADYKLPSFDGGTALKIVRQQYPTIPVVMVTGAVGDEKAIELLKQGARDYVLKDRLARLGTEVQRVLAEEQSIHARKAAEQAMRQSEADFRALVEHSPIAMIVDAGVGADEKIVMMNRKFTELFGYTLEDVPDAQHWWPLAYPDEAYREKIKAEWTQRVEKAFRNRSSIEPMEASMTCKDGAIRYIRGSFASIGDKNILGFEDLTQRKQAEDELERFFNLIPDLVCIASADGHFLKINPAWQELLGYTTQEILAKTFLDLIHPDDRAATVKEVERQLAGEATMQFSNRYRCKDGSYRWLEWKATPAVGGQLLFASARDITERKQAEARIQKLTRLYATLSQINQIIVRSTTSREELFLNICDAAVTYGNFIMAWVGLVDETTRTVKPVCHYGAENGYLTNIDVGIDDVPSGRGPTGIAIRENRVSYVNDYANDARTLPWRAAALQRSFRCAAGLPLRFGDKVIGALTLYADEPEFFDADQLNLLEEMATDVSFALNNIAHEAERSATELQLKERERQYHTLADSGQALIWTAGTDKLCDYFNKVWLEFTGRPLEQLLGNGWADDVHPDDFAQCLATYVGAFDRREPFSMLYRLRRHDGEYRWLQDDGCPRYNAAGEFIGYIGYCLDITDHKKAEARLAESEQHFRAVAESANDAIVTATGDGRITGWNTAATRMFGYSKDEVIGQSLTLLMPERFRALHQAGLARVASGGESHVIGKTVELVGLHKDGSEFPIELSLSHWQVSGSHFFSAILRDIGERKRAEKDLRLFKELLDKSNDAIFINDAATSHILSVNEQAMKNLGYTREELMRMKITDFETTLPESFLWEQHMKELDAVGYMLIEGRHRRKDGIVFPVEVSARNIQLEGRKYNLAIVRDISERKRTQDLIDNQFAEILNAKLEWQLVFDSINQPIFIHDREFRIVRANRAYIEQAGASYQEIIGQLYYEVFPKIGAPLPGCMRALDQTATTDAQAVEDEEVVIGEKTYRSRTFAAHDSEDKYLYSVHILEDVTERKKMEAQVVEQYEHVAGINTQLLETNKQLKLAQGQLLQSAKMASVGLLAAGVAHEINNPIGYVNSNMGTLEKYLADIFAVIDKFEAAEMLLGMLVNADDPLLEELRQFKEKINLDYVRKDIKALIAESQQGLERVKRIVLDLKNFSHADSDDQWLWADVHQLLDTTLNVIWNELKYKCEVVKEYGVLPKIYCLPSQLDQVFMNLLVNAAQAIEVRGKITLRTGQEGERVWVEVSDTGKGIPPEYIPNLFDPFFTTKPVGQGTGLGLSVSYNIVAKHHGKIEVHSEVGKGSTFRVWLPVQQLDTGEEA